MILLGQIVAPIDTAVFLTVWIIGKNVKPTDSYLLRLASYDIILI